jgi:rhodanese-related sulfurtransferase
MDETVRIDAVINQARREKKVLLVYDAVGRQVEWFQYHLESRGLKDYYFMKGGAQAYVDMKGKTVASQAR